MAELTVPRLRELLSRETNRAAMAERQVRDLASENARLRNELRTLLAFDRSGEQHAG